MRVCYLAISTFLVLHQVIKLTDATVKCDQTDTETLECFSCSDEAPSASSYCSNSTGTEIFSNWGSQTGKVNETR